MNRSLIFRTSEIFDDSNIIDRIRQTYFDLEVITNEEEIHDFLKEALEYLENDLSNDTASEFFTTILACFQHLPNKLTNAIEILLKKSRVNANYIIVTSSIVFYLNNNHQQLLTQECKSFIDDALNEIILQVKEKTNQTLKIFDHVIPPLFTNDLILNLILSSNITKEIFSVFFHYIFIQNIFSKNSKFNSLIQKLSNSGFIQILPQTESSNQEIYEFISNKNFELLPLMNENSLSLIETAFFYIENEGKIDFEGIKDETVLQFGSVLMIYLEKSYKNSNISILKYKNNIINIIKMLPYNNSPVINASIDFFLKNKFKFSNMQLIQMDDMFQIFFILTKQLLNGNYNANKMLLLENIFYLTYCDNYEMISIFFNEFADDLMKFIASNLEEINNYEAFKRKKLNLMFYNPSTIINIFSSFSEADDVIKFVYFIENLCYNQPIIVSSPQISEPLMKVIHQKINEENWDDVLLIGEFMKKNDFVIELFELKELQIPKHIKSILFVFIQDVDQNDNENVDHILSNILSDPNLKDIDFSLKKLFDLMMKDKEIRQSYLTYLILSYAFKSNLINSLSVIGILKLFKKEYELYKDEFVDIVNKIYYYNGKESTFLAKDGFILTSLPISEFGQSIIFKLFDSIKRKPGNYEAFICLKSISSSFPFLFDRIFDKVCDIVSREMEYYDIIFENNESDENLRFFKTYISAHSFILSTLQSSYCIDQFIQWFFNNMLTLSDNQLISFLQIMNHLTQIGATTIAFNVYILRLNILEKIGKLLERKLVKNNYINCYKKYIFSFLLKIYQKFDNINNYEMIQIDEYVKIIENPISYFEDYTFKQALIFNTAIKSNEINLNETQYQFVTFIQNLHTKYNFWLEHSRNSEIREELKIDEIIEFCSKLDKHELLTDMNDLQNVPSEISVKMVRSLVLKQYPLYSHFLFKSAFPFVVDNKKELVDIAKNLNEIQKQESENPNDVDNINIDLFNSYDYLFPQYCHQTLFKNLVKELTNSSLNDECYSILLNLIQTISTNEVSYVSFLEFISQHFSEIYENCNESNINYSINAMTKLINALKLLSKINGFEQNFVDLCGKNILNLVLTPKLRNNSNLILKTAELFLILEKDLPIRITQLICCMLSNKNIELNTTFKLIKKFDCQKLNNVKHFILSSFDIEMKKMQLSQLYIKSIEYFPSIINERKEMMFSLLDNLLHKYFYLNENDENMIQNIGSLFDILSPTRKELNNLTTANNKSTITQKIKEISPKFWNLFEKYNQKIMDLIENYPILLNKFRFFCEFPEFASFKIRSSFFRKKMKNKINDYSRLTLNIDRKNILTSSYKSFLNKSTDQLLKRFNIEFNGEQSIDEGGPTREWFTTLSKEIFNQNYGLFECSQSTKCYQPSKFSDVNPNHIEYFKFAGKFVARALIQGQCIDAHFSTSFYKQILKHELNYKDVEDFDNELYKNLDWMLHNDVDSLCMYFEVDTKELGILKTISLKENGNEIEVTNENKDEYVNLRANYALKMPIESQVNAFCEGFYSLIDYNDIKIFTPKELDLLICGIPEINVKDFIENTTIDYPYNSNTPVIKYFFDAISKWENEKLAKLLLFMTGSSRVPSNGFKEFCEMTGSPLKISSGGDKTRIPQSHTCFNQICLPRYESEEELNEKLILAIDECNTYEMS